MTEHEHATTVRTREQTLVDTLVLLADTLVEDYDAVDLLDQLVMAAVSILDVTAAGLLLDDQRGNLAVIASSNDETRLLEIFQLQNAHGPCLECVASREVVVITDLQLEAQRWPLFVPAALAAGFRSVVAVPMRLRDETIGALNLFRIDPGTVPPQDVRVAQALADVATIGILQQRSSHRSSMLAEQLQRALNSRVVIEQAKGILAERHQVEMSEAFQVLRRYARAHNLKLGVLAQDVVTGTIIIPSDD